MRPYPDNLLPGLTQAMREQFPQALQEQFPQALQAAAIDPNATSTDADAAPYESSAPANNSAPAAAKAKGTLMLPLTGLLSVVVDKDQHRLALLSGNRIIRLYEVGLGADRTPEGHFAVTEKVRNPNNRSSGEFGSRGMTLSDSLYAIHGTNKPDSIGKDETHGCIRLRQADIEELYDMVPQGTKVTIGTGLLPPGAPLSHSADAGGTDAGSGDKEKGKPAFRLPLQTNDSNPKKTYRWLD